MSANCELRTENRGKAAERIRKLRERCRELRSALLRASLDAQRWKDAALDAGVLANEDGSPRSRMEQ